MTLKIGLHKLEFSLNSYVLLALIILLAIFMIRTYFRNRLVIKDVNFNFAGLGSVNICQNLETTQLAHRAWIELATRKAAIPFDEENDVLVEVYDSWYQLFKALREIVQQVPTGKKWNEDREEIKIVNSIIGTLNTGMRPHLTKWQARFRRWYAQAISLEINSQKSPQEIQREYPEYEALISDLNVASKGLVAYAEELRKIAHSKGTFSPLYKRKQPK